MPQKSYWFAILAGTSLSIVMNAFLIGIGILETGDFGMTWHQSMLTNMPASNKDEFGSFDDNRLLPNSHNSLSATSTPLPTNLSGNWKDNEGFAYSIEDISGELSLEGKHPNFPDKAVIGRGMKTGKEVAIRYRWIDGQTGIADLELSNDGQQMSGEFQVGNTQGEIILRR